MSKEIIHSNIFFNYAVKVLIKDCILPTLNNSLLDDNIQFIVSIDNRNIKVNDLKGLENYLKTEFCINGFDFKVTYYDSKTNFGIQLADLIVNTFYNYYKDFSIIENIVPHIKNKNFKISLFPGNKKTLTAGNLKNNIDSFIYI